MTMALTAALTAGKVTQDTTFSGSLFQSLVPKMKEASLTGMWNVREWLCLESKRVWGTKTLGAEERHYYYDMIWCDMRPARILKTWTTVEQSRRFSRVGRDVQERRASCCKFQDCSMTRLVNLWTDSKRLVKVLLRGCHVAQLYSRIERTRVMYRVWRRCSGAKKVPVNQANYPTRWVFFFE